MDWEAIRAEFPALANWTYLNTATFGQLPRAATEAVSRHWQHRDETACGDFLDWFSDADRLRVSLAQLIHASADDIAFAPSAAHALSSVAVGLGFAPNAEKPGNIVTLQGDFPNQLYLPHLREVPWERFFESIDHETKLVAISEVNYATGFRPPLAQIVSFIRSIPAERRPVFYVDGTQSLGALQFDVLATPVDVYAVHGYKWLLSPNGAGFFYISQGLRDRLQPSVIGWRSHHDWRNVDSLHHGAPEFKPTAEKYEGGGLPSALLYAMEASVNFIHSIGPAEIERRVLELADSVRGRVHRLGGIQYHAEASGRSQIVAVRFPGHDVSEIARTLKNRRVLVAARHGYLRISPHFYNSESDLDRLETELRSLL